MRCSELISKMEEYKAQYGDTLVRFYVEHEDKDMRVETVYPVNIGRAERPIWCCMLSD